jgi:hypothetical protein
MSNEVFCLPFSDGSYLMSKDVLSTQCDPSGAIDEMETCRSSGPAVFGAMLGVAFAAQVSQTWQWPLQNFAFYYSRLSSFHLSRLSPQGMSQLATSIEALSGARAACAQAMTAIDRTLGTEATSVTVKVGTKKDEEGGDEVDLEET